MEIRGLTKVLANINATTLLLTKDAKRIVHNCGRLVERRAKQNISGMNSHQRHIITGNLRNSIDTKKPKQIKPFVYQVQIGSSVVYAVFVEARDKTGGFLRPALFESKKQVNEYIKRTLAGEVLL